MHARVISVSRSAVHGFHKTVATEISLRAGLGVAGDVHEGVTVKHRSRVAVDPTQPNLRQVHLIHAELFDELRAKGFAIAPGDLGENVVTQGLDLLQLPTGTILHLGETARIEITGLRNPCIQIDRFRPGLLKEVLGKAPGGKVIRKAGIMGVVLESGTIRAGDAVRVSLPQEPHRPLDRV
jgi:MOSC domain-containing protein YiiM